MQPWSSPSGVILSTLFIKQHYIADEIAGIALAWIIGTLLFKKLWKTPINQYKGEGGTNFVNKLLHKIDDAFVNALGHEWWARGDLNT